MKFKTVAEAFNYYRNFSKENIEKRAAEIKGQINTDPEADIISLNIEIEGLNQALENLKEKQGGNENQPTPGEARNQFNPITSRNFEGSETVPEKDIFSSKEYRNAFFKTMLGKKLTNIEERTFNRAMEIADSEKRTDSFSTTTNSAAVLPTETLNEIISKARKMGGLISECRNFNIPSNIKVPIGTPKTKASWHTEGASVESEKPDVAYVGFNGYEIIKIFSISAAAKKMSIEAFESYIIEELTNCVMECIADSLVNGTGSNQGTGILSGITWDTTNTVTVSTSIDYSDFTDALALLKKGYSKNAKWAMNNTTLYKQVYSIVDTTGRPIMISDPKNEAINYVLGKEVVIDDNLPDNTIILGNFKYLGYNIPNGIVIETSRESSFKSGLIDYRAMAIADTQPLVSEAFVKMARSQS